MIKYHGTPVGGTRRDAMLFLQGRNGLISFATQGHIPEVLEQCDSFCLDNGAFSIWKRGEGQIDLQKYNEWVDSLATHPAFDFCIIPDVIGGTNKENDKMLELWDSLHESIPVYHLGGDPQRFLELAKSYRKVAFGSTDKWPRNGSRKWWAYMADFMDEVTDEHGRLPCKVHGLRMLDPKLFQYLPLHSADSTNAVVNGGLAMKKGVYPSMERWQGSERIARRVEAHQGAAVWDRQRLINDGILEE